MMTVWTHTQGVLPDRNAIAQMLDMPKDKGRSFAFAQYKNHAAYFAMTLEAEVDAETGLIKISHVVSAVDCGVTEAAQGPAGAAIANAFKNATGKRIYDLPFTRDRVKASLGA